VTELISTATEIRVIGYSFSGIDEGPILDLLGQAHRCRRIVVQNPDADQIIYRSNCDESSPGSGGSFSATKGSSMRIMSGTFSFAVCQTLPVSTRS
jgi:hypothetical protein